MYKLMLMPHQTFGYRTKPKGTKPRTIGGGQGMHKKGWMNCLDISTNFWVQPTAVVICMML